MPSKIPGSNTVHGLFEDQAARTPDAVAVVDGGTRLRYRELNDRANRLARRLLPSLPGTEPLVALAMDRSPDLVTAVLAVLKAGGAFLPLDPAHPADRLRRMIEDARPALILTQAAHRARLGELPYPVQTFEDHATALDTGSGSNLDLPISPDNLLYVIYTSGSTGQPKGVMVEHRNVARLFHACRKWFDFGRDVWTQIHSFSFGFSQWEIWGALLHGGTLVLVPGATILSAGRFRDLLESEKVSVLSLTPSAFRMLLLDPVAAGRPPAALRTIMLSGEPPVLEDLARWFDLHGEEGPGLFSTYAITEAGGQVTTIQFTRASTTAGSPRLLGENLEDMRVDLTDATGRPVEDGETGEIVIRGAGVARGYRGDPERTREKFGEASSFEDRAYRTGDLGRRLPDGTVEFRGRGDHQVKIRGYRVELGDIEAALAAHAGVAEAAVTARGEGAQARLAAYVVKREGALETASLREHLRERVPEYMIPSDLLFLDALPRNTSGKIDRRALPDPASLRTTATADAPRTPLEHVLHELWKRVLDRDDLGIHDRFFEQGGTSIQAMQISSELQRRMDAPVYVIALFDAPTIAELAAYLEREYPQQVVKIRPIAGDGDPAARAGSATPCRLTVEHLDELQRAIPPLAPGPPPGSMRPRKNPRAVFVLSAPRSGSTLMRVMLAGHPRLFSPPELVLLSYNTLDERRRDLEGRESLWREGAIQALMDASRCDLDGARREMEELEAAGMTVKDFYLELQQRAAPRLLVDKVPYYALDPATLRRAEEDFDEPLYIHLMRHPAGMVHSYRSGRFDLFYRFAHRLDQRELPEAVWNLCHRNIGDLLETVPAERQIFVRFEDMVQDPEGQMKKLASFLGVEYDESLTDPYAFPERRMIQPIQPETKALGDWKLLDKTKIETAVADAWRGSFDENTLAPITWERARRYGYLPAGTTVRRDADGRKVTHARRIFPLSSIQQVMWARASKTGFRSAHNIPLALQLDGPLDRNALKTALDGLIERHASLRTTFLAKRRRQVVHRNVHVPIQHFAAAGPGWGPRGALLRRWFRRFVLHPFHLVKQAPVRAGLLKRGPEDHLFVLVVSHLVCDGWSVNRLVRDFGELYRAAAGGRRPELAAIETSFGEYARWESRDQDWAEIKARAAKRREEIASHAGQVTFPGWRSLPGGKGNDSVMQHVRGWRADLLRRIGARERLTAAMLVTAIAERFVTRVTGRRRFCLAMPVLALPTDAPEAPVGMYANIAIHKAEVVEGESWLSHLHRVRREVFEGLALRDVPYRWIFPATKGLTIMIDQIPKIDTTFTAGELTAQRVKIPWNRSTYPLALFIVEKAGEYEIEWAFQRKYFDEPEIRRLMTEFWAELEDLLTAMRPSIEEIDPLAGNFTDALDLATVERPDHPYIEYPGGSISYVEFRRVVDRLAGNLVAAGVEPEDMVVVLAKPGVQLAAAIFAIPRIGAVQHMLSPSLPMAEIAGSTVDLDVRFWLCDSSARAPEGARVLSIEELCPIDPAARATEVPVALRRVPGTHPAMVLRSSGTTGRAKHCIYTHAQTRRKNEWRPHLLGEDWHARALLLPSMEYASGRQQLMTMVEARGTVVLPPPGMGQAVKGGQLLRIFMRKRITYAYITPVHIQNMIDAAPPGGPHIPRTRLFVSAAVLPQQRWEQARVKLTRRMYNFYATNELGAVCIATPREVVQRPGSVGRPIPGVAIDILDAEDRPLPPGELGLVAVNAVAVPREYVKAPELSDLCFRGGYNFPGDQGWKDADGFLYLQGRSDDVINNQGVKFYPVEVEEVLARHPSIRDCAVIGWSTPEAGEVAIAYVVSDAEVDSRELTRFCRRSLPAYKCPVRYHRVDELPRNPTGKLLRSEMRRRHHTQRGTQPDRSPPRRRRPPPF